MVLIEIILPPESVALRYFNRIFFLRKIRTKFLKRVPTAEEIGEKDSVWTILKCLKVKRREWLY